MDANDKSKPNLGESALARRVDHGQGFASRVADRRASNRSSFGDFPLALFTCDRAGAVISHNEAAAALWGRRPDPSRAGQWCGALDVLDAHGMPMARSDYPAAKAFRTRREFAGTKVIVLRPDGGTRRIAAYAKAALGSDGVSMEVTCALLDQTERDALVAALRRSEDEKNAFIAMLSHELRNPLSPILNAALVMKRLSKDSQLSKMADVVERQAKRLSRFVSDLVNAAHLAKGGVSLTLGQVGLAEVMQAAVDSLTPLSEPRGQVVVIEPWPNATLLCDGERVSQALANVMVNASEFTGSGGHIIAKACVEGSTLRIEVEDTGIGIDPAHIQEIFRPYTHFATHADRARAGAGLGLALAKDICEKHGGEIMATSRGVGCGSMFTISLPVVVVAREVD